MEINEREYGLIKDETIAIMKMAAEKMELSIRTESCDNAGYQRVYVAPKIIPGFWQEVDTLLMEQGKCNHKQEQQCNYYRTIKGLHHSESFHSFECKSTDIPKDGKVSLQAADCPLRIKI